MSTRARKAAKASTAPGNVRSEAAYPDKSLSRKVLGTSERAKRRLEKRRRRLVVLALITSDVVFALLAWAAAFSLLGTLPDGWAPRTAIAGALPNVAVWVGLRVLLGLYPAYGFSRVEELRRQTYATLTALAITIIFAGAFGRDGTLTPVLLAAGVSGLALLLSAPVVRCFVKSGLRGVGLWGKPVVVMGASGAGASLLRTLRQDWEVGLRPLAVFDNRLPPKGGVLEGVPYGGKLAEAPALARELGADTAVFAMPHTRREHLARFVGAAALHFRHVVVIPNLGGVTNSAVTARDFAGTTGLEIGHNLLDPRARGLKRALDLALTAFGGLLVLPLLLVLSFLVWLESGGPVFYSDERVGRDGRLFACLKFRTMVPRAEDMLAKLLQEDAALRQEYMKYHKLREDPRVTRIGHFLRKTSLDELPQLWNVLRGDMSLVGPRPYLPRESDDIGRSQGDILRVYPGITGPWQVGGRNRASFSERVRMDVHYVRDWSIWLDVLILARTVRCVLRGRDAF